MKAWKIMGLFLVMVLLTSCSLGEEASKTETSSTSRGFAIRDFDSDSLRIVAGSENKVLEPIIEDFARSHQVNMEIDYMGSLDIMKLLESGQVDYDAVWPASSIWLNLGDDHRLLKHTAASSISPVVFGIKRPLAQELGFVDREVTTQEIIEAIQAGKLKFSMTSASQSNSGASAYLGFLTALASSEGGLTQEDLENPQVQAQITSLLKGVERSSGSSNWLVELFMQGDYDAMVNYETLIIQTNQALEKEGKDPLYCIYPVDGLSISDSPLAYVDKGEAAKEEIFLAFQDYILSDKAQAEIEKTGKRSAYGTVRKENQGIYKKEWGIDLDRVLSPIRWPKAPVIMEALALYQSQFKKPALTLYVLDYSGSMYGEGIDQMNQALSQVLLPERAKENLLLGTDRDKTILIPFADGVYGHDQALGNGDDLKALYETSQTYELGGGTSMYEGIIYGLDLLEAEGEDLDHYTPAIVVLSDGQANGWATLEDLEGAYRHLDKDVPIFSILFGQASPDQLQEVAELSRGRVFDGRQDMVAAFQSVKGYN
ncbi:MAG: VWA domain-containing protein [Tissierellia bacterium]|nr:VWA domain-containing protein [Tissierellia bacterium]